MESVVRKCLNVRERSFEENSCPRWLLSILPTRIKSVQSILDQDQDQQQQQQLKRSIDLSPYQLITRIPLLNEQKIDQISLNHTEDEEEEHFEYPNDVSFEKKELKNVRELLYSPSTDQLLNLLNQLKEFEEKKERNEMKKSSNLKKCVEEKCSHLVIPLTSYCKKHLLDKETKQIFFVKCCHCDELSISEDKKNILHFCSHLHLKIDE